MLLINGQRGSVDRQYLWIKIDLGSGQTLGVRAVGGWCRRGGEQGWIGHGDTARHIACPGRDDGGLVHRSLIAAFIGENGFGLNASEGAVGLWRQ
jgi:alkylation response protein AidB-like acyl-CoA dehydrogenase